MLFDAFPNDVSVHSHERHRLQPVRMAGNQVVHLGAFELAAGHPDHAIVPGQGGIGRVRVGGLGVVDSNNAPGFGHLLPPVAGHLEGLQRLRDD